LLKRIRENRIHFGKDHTTVPNNKTYLKKTENQSLTSMRYVDGRAASNRLKDLFGEKVFTNPKDEFLLSDLFKAMQLEDNDIVMDFFAGSCSSAHAVFQLNRTYGSNCQIISVQVPEDLNEALKLAAGGAKKVTANAIKLLKSLSRPTVVSEISKERIRRTGAKILEGDTHPDWNRDVGFRVLKIDSSNMADVYYTPDATTQADLLTRVDNIKQGRSPEDLLFQVLLDWGVDLTLPILRETLHGKIVFTVACTALIACFDTDVDEVLVKDLTTRKPLRVVFKDTGFKDDATKINVKQIFKSLSPDTDVKAI
jgi:adenine-specific DNA-methyltransferase